MRAECHRVGNTLGRATQAQDSVTTWEQAAHKVALAAVNMCWALVVATQNFESFLSQLWGLGLRHKTAMVPWTDSADVTPVDTLAWEMQGIGRRGNPVVAAAGTGIGVEVVHAALLMEIQARKARAAM